MDLKWITEDQSDGSVLVKLDGELTEAFEYSPLIERLGEDVRLDLSGVSRINSSGVREWIRFVSTLTNGRRVRLEKCAVPIVQQFNMISNMSGGAQIQSIMLPYHCDDCGEDEEILLDLSKGRALQEEMECPHCKGTMVFDDLPDAYLSFLDA